MLAAYAELKLWPNLPPASDRDFDQLADAGLVETHEGIAFDQAARQIFAQEASRVVAAHPERGLRQIIRAEAEKLRRLGNFAGHQSGPRQFDHGSDQIGRLPAPLGRDLIGYGCDTGRQEIWLALEADQRQHDFESDAFTARILDVYCGFQYRSALHLVDFGVSDAEPAATVAEHRIGLGKRDRAGPQFAWIRTRRLRHFGNLFVRMG